MISEYTLDDFRNSIKRLYNQTIYGCGNHGCLINPPKCLATNAGCQCSPRRIASDLRKLAEILESKSSGWEVHE